MLFCCAVVTTVAGSGVSMFIDATGTQAGFADPTGVVVDASGNIYVAAFGDHRVRKINPAGGAHAFVHVCSYHGVSNGLKHACISCGLD